MDIDGLFHSTSLYVEYIAKRYIIVYFIISMLASSPGRPHFAVIALKNGDLWSAQPQKRMILSGENFFPTMAGCEIRITS